MRDHWDDRLVGLESVLLGERNLAQQTLEIVIFGYATSQEAEGALRRQMEKLIRTQWTVGDKRTALASIVQPSVHSPCGDVRL
jgi:hypothetical protein